MFIGFSSSLGFFFVFLFVNFYCAMHVYAKPGIAMVSRLSVYPSVCLSVTLMYRGRMCWVSSKVITRIISLGSSLLGATTSTI